MDLFERFFEDALRIHAICFDESLSDDEARILTYIHAKSNISENGLGHFQDTTVQEVDALEIMLGLKQLIENDVEDTTGSEMEGTRMIRESREQLRALDAVIEQQYGIERRFQGELSRRLRLYKDPSYCKKMIDLYINKIAPKVLCH